MTSENTSKLERYVAILDSYLSGASPEDALRHCTEDYRLWFYKREGNGVTRDQVARLLEWDCALNPRHHYRDLSIGGKVLSAAFHEENDFSRLIDYPGWDARVTFWFDDNDLIKEQLYEPDQPELDYHAWLAAALPWLEVHHPDELADIYKDKRLVQSAESAAVWVDILGKWRKATGRPELR